MSEPRLVYRHAVEPDRGFAATGALFFVKWLLALPHLLVVSALNTLMFTVAYIGYFLVAFTGSSASGIQHFIEIAMRWNARTFGWIVGFTDLYPPFETDPEPEYPVDLEIEVNESPSKGWAIAGIFFIRAVVLIPHVVALTVVGLAAFIATWVGYWTVLLTGSLPVGIQDFVAGVMQWGYRVNGFLVGLSDEYPAFSLEVSPRE